MTKNKERALAALMSSPTHEAAAAKAGITSRTLRRYMQDPEFAAEYNRINSQLVTAATLQIQRSLSPAISTMREIPEDRKASMSAQIQAARGLLEYGIRLSELGDVYAHIETLEAAMEVDKPEFFTLTYTDTDGHTERTRDLNIVIDAVFAEQGTGLIKVSGPREVNNLFHYLTP